MRFFAGIHFEDLDVQFLADGEHVGGLVHAAVRNVGHVQHAVHAADVDEGAVIEQAAHRAADHRRPPAAR